ncbi:MAG: M15 family metallopeptidase [Oscillospiraceae bacterium]
MPKKLAVLAICAALSCSLFTGCWWDNSSSSSSSSRPQVSSSSSVKPGSSSMLPDASSMLPGSSSMLPGSSSMMPGSSSASSSKPSSAAANAAVEDLAWATRLVNAQNPLPENFTVKTTAIRGYDNREFDHRAAQSLEALLHDAEQVGNKLYLVSAYRSIERQAALFKRKTAFYTAQGKCLQDAEKEAAKWVARPGTSEHNTGLAADMVSASWYENNSDLTQAFEATPEFAWLSAHCSEYGFILRYPKGKEDITGIAYEPWHYRYVGKNAAEKICKAELCLEEYFLQDA